MNLLCWHPRSLSEACRNLRVICLQSATGLFFSVWAYLGGHGLPSSSKAKPGLLFSLEVCVTFALGGLSHQLIWQSCLEVKCPKEAFSASNSAPWPAWWQGTCTASTEPCSSSGAPLSMWGTGCLQQPHQDTGIYSWRHLASCQIVSFTPPMNEDFFVPMSLEEFTACTPHGWRDKRWTLCVGAELALKGAHIHGDGHVGETE